MKKIATTILINFGRICGSVALFAFATVGTAFADNISKSFEFGEGTPQPRSHVRTFPLPCGTEGGVAAVVKFQRLGPAGASNNISIIIEFREPDTAPDQEGPIVETKTATATRTQQTVILRSQASNRGCSLPWRVRVRYATEGTAPVQTFGTIRLDFDGRVRNIECDFSPVILKGASRTLNFGDSGGLGQGRIEMIEANWIHTIGGTPLGGNPIKLRIELIDPSGTVVKTAEGFAKRDRDLGLPILKLIYQVTKCTPGQWKLKVTNLDANDDVNLYDDYTTFTPGCQN